MRSFNSISEFSGHLLKMAAAERVALEQGIKQASSLIENTAKSEFGVYQPEVGPFQGWAELAESTKEDRARKGFPEDEPLLRTGKLKDSISHKIKGLEAAIGSDSDVMVYQEFGTQKIPPRPVLGPAAYRNKKKIKKIIGAAAVTGLLGGGAIHPSLKYDFNVEE